MAERKRWTDEAPACCEPISKLKIKCEGYMAPFMIRLTAEQWERIREHLRSQYQEPSTILWRALHTRSKTMKKLILASVALAVLSGCVPAMTYQQASWLTEDQSSDRVILSRPDITGPGWRAREAEYRRMRDVVAQQACANYGRKPGIAIRQEDRCLSYTTFEHLNPLCNKKK